MFSQLFLLWLSLTFNNKLPWIIGFGSFCIAAKFGSIWRGFVSPVNLYKIAWFGYDFAYICKSGFLFGSEGSFDMFPFPLYPLALNFNKARVV